MMIKKTFKANGEWTWTLTDEFEEGTMGKDFDIIWEKSSENSMFVSREVIGKSKFWNKSNQFKEHKCKYVERSVGKYMLE